MSNSFKTPILFLIFNRPDLSIQVFNQIRIIRPKYLFVAADGPRSGREDDKIKCKETREIIEQIDWTCEVKKLYREENLGCGFAVCSAISWFFDQVEEGIILEDDCLPDLSFFPFCADLLAQFKEDETIYHIAGTNVQNGIIRGEGSYYFSNYTLTWGWASWRRAWKHFRFDIPDYNQTINSGELDHVFQTMPEKYYWRNKLKKAKLDKKDIWDYQWYYAVWKNKGLGITTNVNLIKNIGFRNNPVHHFLNDSMREPSIKNSISFPLIHPQKKVNREADIYTFKNTYSHSVFRLFRLIKENKIQNLLRYIITSYFNSNFR